MDNDLISRSALLKRLFPYGMPDDGNYGINAKAVMVAIMGAPNTENRPLTTDELLMMNGKRVWCSSMDGGFEKFNDVYCGWYTVCGNKLIDARGQNYRVDHNNDFMGFRAYLHQPKEVDDG